MLAAVASAGMTVAENRAALSGEVNSVQA